MEIQMIVLNVNVDTRAFDKVFAEAARNGGKMPEALSDIFKMEIREVTDSKTGKLVNRAFVDFV